MGFLHRHHHARIYSLGPDVGAVAVEPVVQQLRRGLLRCRLHRSRGVQIDGVISTEHCLSAEAGGSAVVVEAAVKQLGLGLGCKR